MFVSPSVGQFPPLRITAQPCLGENLGRALAGTPVPLRSPRTAASLRLDFPTFAVGADVDVATPPRTLVAIPPVTFDSH